MLDQPQPPMHSKFGGMWIDRIDFEAEMAARLRDGRVAAHLEAPIRQLERDGYAILRGAADMAALDRFEREISTAFREGHDELILQVPGDNTPHKLLPGTDPLAMRVVDCYSVMPSALDLFATPPLVELLRTVFDDTPMLFQSLSFHTGSGQGLHQDTAYVVLADRPMELLACWIALEDVHPASGPLQYLEGSHRLGDFDFNGHKNWNPERDGEEIHNMWAFWIHEESARRGMAHKTFSARRGDIFVWHADLAHGGAPIEDPQRTRKSLVGHFCPQSASPMYMVYAPDRAVRRKHGPIAYCSAHFALPDEPEPPETVQPKPQMSWFARIKKRFLGPT